MQMGVDLCKFGATPSIQCVRSSSVHPIDGRLTHCIGAPTVGVRTVLGAPAKGLCKWVLTYANSRATPLNTVRTLAVDGRLTHCIGGTDGGRTHCIGGPGQGVMQMGVDLCKF